VQQLNLDFELGIMQLDERGVRIPHDQPLRTFLAELPCGAPCEAPDACESVSGATNKAETDDVEQLPEPLPLRPAKASSRRPKAAPVRATQRTPARPSDSPGPALSPPRSSLRILHDSPPNGVGA
jgi:hypothetical protein